MTTLIAIAALLAPETPDASDIVQKAFEDASFRASIKTGKQSELQKINKDFAQAYRFNYTDVMIKEPGMLRVESKVGDTSVFYILNGTTQLMSAPRARFKQRTNLSDKPGRRQTPLDFGFLTPSMFKDLFQAKFIRTDRETKEWVFDLTYLSKYDDSTRHRIWIDPQKRITTRREWYDQSGNLRATFRYENPVSKDGVWLPTRNSVKNIDNVLAGVTEYENLKVNSGLSSSLFNVN